MWNRAFRDGITVRGLSQVVDRIGQCSLLVSVRVMDFVNANFSLIGSSMIHYILVHCCISFGAFLLLLKFWVLCITQQY